MYINYYLFLFELCIIVIVTESNLTGYTAKKGKDTYNIELKNKLVIVQVRVNWVTVSLS